MTSRWRVLGIVQAGWFGTGVGCSVRTYETGQLPPASLMVESEGAWVVDGRSVSVEQAIEDAVRGPMCDPDLAPGYYSRPLERVPNRYLGERLHALDSIATDLWVELRRSHGYRIGRVEGGHVVWE